MRVYRIHSGDFLVVGGLYVPAILRVCNAVFCTYGFYKVVTVNSDYFLKHPFYLCNDQVWCSL
jgi:hypothetical protein